MTISCGTVGVPTSSPVAGSDADIAAVTTLSEVNRVLASDPHEVLVVVGPDIDLDDVLAFAAEKRLTRPSLGVVLLRDELDVSVLSKAIRAGIREVVPANELGLVADACQRSMELSRSVPATMAPSAEPPGEGKIVTVLSTKGGCGKTTIATNLAIALHGEGKRRICLVDLDLAFGDVAISLQLAPKRTLVDGVAMGNRIDETGVAGLLTEFRPGLECLLAPVEPGDMEKVPAALISEMLDVLRGMFDYVVVDTPPQLNEHVLSALDKADHHVLLANPDMPTVKNLRLTLDILDLLSYSRDIRSVVLNREDPRVGMTADDIETVTKTPVAARIPASIHVPLSINRGVPITMDAPAHPVSVAIRSFAATSIAKIPVGASEATRAGILPRRRRKSA